MNLGINPVHCDFLTCNEDSIVAVAEWANYHYELMFSGNWSFVFKKNLKQSLGASLGVKNNNVRKKLAKYHGIKVKPVKISPSKIIKIIEHELKQGKPIIVSMDSFLCPWDWNFQKKHISHEFLITGMDNNEILHCCDGFYMTCETITKEEFIQGFTGECIIFKFKGYEKIYVNWGKILENTVNKLKDNYSFLHAFKSMRSFADNLENLTDIQNEILGYKNNLFEAPLIKNLEHITYSRRKVAKFLQYLGEETGQTVFYELSNAITKAASQWANVRANLIKIAFSKDISVKNQVAAKIREIADLEEDIANQISHISQKNKKTSSFFSNKLTKNNESSIENIVSDNKKGLFIDLSLFLNNKAFGDSVSADSSADLSGTGIYLLKENFDDKNNIWKVNEMEFKFPEICARKSDNISCKGQKIYIQKGIYQNIAILGCAEWGSYINSLIIHYMDDQIEEISIKFTDCLYKPLYGETIAWEGRAVEIVDGNAQLWGSKVYMIAQSYGLKLRKNVKFLLLPDCPGLHIFAITMT